jgi:hypothetical protein
VDALEWLKANNQLYRNIEVDAKLVNTLPKCGIPASILDNICMNESTDELEGECATYVPDCNNVGFTPYLHGAHLTNTSLYWLVKCTIV